LESPTLVLDLTNSPTLGCRFQYGKAADKEEAARPSANRSQGSGIRDLARRGRSQALKWRHYQAVTVALAKRDITFCLPPLDRQHAAFIAKRAASQNEL
jgi:hypothetical protein